MRCLNRRIGARCPDISTALCAFCRSAHSASAELGKMRTALCRAIWLAIDIARGGTALLRPRQVHKPSFADSDICAYLGLSTALCVLRMRRAYNAMHAFRPTSTLCAARSCLSASHAMNALARTHAQYKERLLYQTNAVSRGLLHRTAYCASHPTAKPTVSRGKPCRPPDTCHPDISPPPVLA